MTENNNAVLVKYPSLKSLTLDDLFSAYVSGTPIDGFIVTELTLATLSNGDEAGVHSMKLVHAILNVVVRMSQDGWTMEGDI